MSLCDACRDPGACCRRMRVWRTEEDEVVELQPWADLDIQGQFPGWDLPPLHIVETVAEWTDADGKKYGNYRYGCSALTAEGRCGIYESRPQLCRDYVAGSDRICAEFVSGS